MVNYDWFRKFLADELFTAHVELNRRNLEQVAEHIVQRMETKRLIVVPTFSMTICMMPRKLWMQISPTKMPTICILVL